MPSGPDVSAQGGRPRPLDQDTRQPIEHEYEYQHDRDRLTTPLLLAADEIAAGGWSATRIVELLTELNTAMAAEVVTITGWDDPPRRDVAPAA